mgnify:FL=1
MADWATFAAFAGVVLGLLLVLAHLSQQSLDADGDPAGSKPERVGASVEGPFSGAADAEALDPSAEPDVEGPSADDAESPSTFDAEVAAHRHRRPATVVEGEVSSPATNAGESPGMSTGALLANVAVSQGAFGLLLLGGALLAGIPFSAFGVTASTTGPVAIAAGVGLGTALYAANEVGAAASARVGLGRSEALREQLAPDTPGGWAVLLLVVLPIIAGFEELLFRGALVGVIAVGFEVSPWLLAALSSVAFALGHGAQGPTGIVVTGLLGFVLAAAFVLTGSLLVVVVAHYLVNALEFVVHEGLGVEWSAGRGT